VYTKVIENARENAAMTKQLLKYTAKFTAIGFVTAAIYYAIGVNPITAADVTIAAQIVWVGFQIAA
jgi:hypothetical protein